MKIGGARDKIYFNFLYYNASYIVQNKKMSHYTQMSRLEYLFNKNSTYPLQILEYDQTSIVQKMRHAAYSDVFTPTVQMLL